MSRAWDTVLPDSEKLVLLALADWSNDAGECWPSVAQLAKKCTKGERTIQGALKSLEKAGHITRNQIAGRGCRYIVDPRSDCTGAETAPPQELRPAKSAPAQGTTLTPAAAAPNTSVNTSTSTEATLPTKSREPKAAWPCPDGVDPEHWRDFLANRKSKRLGFTPTAHRGQLSALASLSDDEWPPGRLVRHAAERGWGAIHDPRDRQDGQRNGTSTPANLRGSRPDPSLDLARSGAAEERQAECAGGNQADDWRTRPALPSYLSS